MQRRMHEYLRLLEAVAENAGTPLGQIDLLGDDDQRRLLSDWNGVKTDYPRDASLADLFREVARAFPENTALLIAETAAHALPERRISYAELDRLSDQWAVRLRNAGVARGAFVAVLLPRSLDLIVSLLAILKAGAAYVPIAPSMPDAVIQRILEHSGPVALMTVSGLTNIPIPRRIKVFRMDADVQDVAADDLPFAGTGGDPAYVIYTSGSTGAPKGPNKVVCKDW